MELLLGCGSNSDKKLSLPGREQWNGLVRVDFNADHKPDKLWDLENIPLPFEDNSADEIHLYDTLEHLGEQGNFRFFFALFSDFWRILKPDGVLFGISPNWSSPWCWMDPGHKRAVGPQMMGFLNQPAYTKQVGVTPMSDYRFVYKADFDIVHSQVREDGQFHFALQAVKPSRITGLQAGA